MSKRLAVFLAAAVALSGCVTDQPLLVTGIYSMDPERKGACLPPGSISQLGGSLDLAGGGDYMVGMTFVNDLDLTLDTKADQSTLETGLHRNTVIIDSVTYSYTSVPAITFAQESTPLTMVVRPGATANIVRLRLFNRKALEKLFSILDGTTNTGGVLDIRDVKVKVVFTGTVVSGGKISTTPITFPITVFNTGFSCPTPGDTFGALGPCGNPGGQDGARLCCASDASCVVSK